MNNWIMSQGIEWDRWLLIILGMAFWRNWLPNVFKSGSDQTPAAGQVEPQVALLQDALDKSRQIHQHQQKAISFLQKINQQLKERNQLLADYIHKGACSQQESRQQEVAEDLDSLSQELTPLINSLGKGDLKELSPDYISGLKNRSESIKGNIFKMLADMRRQHQELVAKLKKQEDSLRLKEGEIKKLMKVIEGFRDKTGKEPTPASPSLEVEQRDGKIYQLQHVAQEQQSFINALKEENQRLREQQKLILDFISSNALYPPALHEKQPLAALTVVIQEDITPLLNRITKGDYSGLSADFLNRIKNRFRDIEKLITQKQRAIMQQRQELFKSLGAKESTPEIKDNFLQQAAMDQQQYELFDVQGNKEISLRLGESNQEELRARNQTLQNDIRKLNMEIARLQEEIKTKQKLEKTLSETENNLKLVSKQYQSLQAKWEVTAAHKGLAEENILLKKTVSLLQDKLLGSHQQITLLKAEYERLLEEYEKMFSKL